MHIPTTALLGSTLFEKLCNAIKIARDLEVKRSADDIYQEAESVQPLDRTLRRPCQSQAWCLMSRDMLKADRQSKLMYG